MVQQQDKHVRSFSNTQSPGISATACSCCLPSDSPRTVKNPAKPCESAVSGAGIASALDTLAQLRHSSLSRGPSESIQLAPIPSAAAASALFKRARAKYISTAIAVQLAELRSSLEQSYRNTVYCSSVIVQEGGKHRSYYCGNRFCVTCSRIRTARAIAAYGPVFETWDDPHLVTLTVQNVPASELQAALDEITKVLGCNGIPKAMKRTDKVPLVAVRKLECTYNIDRDDYHPHVHLIVQERKAAYLLRDRWLRYFGDRAVIEAQDVKPCDGRSSVELFKYLTKVITKGRDGRRRMVPAAALDEIFRAMRGRRTTQAVGFRLPKKEEESIEAETLEVEASEATKRHDEALYWEWDQESGDWVEHQSGEFLTGYTPSRSYRKLVGSIGETMGQEEEAKGISLPFQDTG